MANIENIEKPWSQKRKEYGIGFGIFLFLFMSSFASTENKKGIGLNGKVLKSIIYYTSTGSKNSIYQIKIKFQGEKRQFEIDNYDYQNFNHKDFKVEVEKGDTVSIKYIGTKIYSFITNGKEYCNIEKSKIHKQKNSLWIKVICVYGILICLIPLLSEKEPKIHYGSLLIIGVIILIILLSNFVGCEYIEMKDYK